MISVDGDLIGIITNFEVVQFGGTAVEAPVEPVYGETITIPNIEVL